MIYHIKEILVGSGIFLIVAGIIAASLFNAAENRKTKSDMTQLCIEKGYVGWDSGADSDRYGISSCVKKVDNG